VNDILGAGNIGQTGFIDGFGFKKSYQRKTRFDSIGYNDVFKKVWETKRLGSNPLVPQYHVRDTIKDGDYLKMTATGLNCTYGLIDNNSPCSLPPAMPGVRNLTTLDIKGS
jgi:hypothetical protein